MMGSLSLDLGPRPDNLRNGEGALIDLRDGQILFAYSKFKGNAVKDHEAADLAIMVSEDGGCSFHEAGVVLTCDSINAENVMSVSLMRMQNGDVGLFYLNRQTLNLMRMYLIRSADEGASWSEPVLCTPEEGFFVVNNDRVVRLSDGTIVIPAAIHRKGFCDSPNEAGEGYYDSRSDAVFFLSRDDGYTWEKSRNKVVMPYTAYCASGLQEPGVVELGSGVLWGFARTDLGRQYEMFSHDGGRTWTAAQPAWFTSPNSALSMKRMPDGRLIAIWNPEPCHLWRQPRVNGFWNGGRTPLVYATSRDDGATFSELHVIEANPGCGYCYVSIHFTKDAMLIAYYAGEASDGSLFARLRIRRIPLSQIE